MLVEIWKANLLRSPVELRDNGGGALLVGVAGKEPG